MQQEMVFTVPTIEANPFKNPIDFKEQISAAHNEWLCILSDDRLLGAEWKINGMTYLLYHSMRQEKSFEIGVIDQNDIPTSHSVYETKSIGLGGWGDILVELPYSRKNRPLQVKVLFSC